MLATKKVVNCPYWTLVMGEVIDGKSKATTSAPMRICSAGIQQFMTYTSKNVQIRFPMLFISLFIYVNSHVLQTVIRTKFPQVLATTVKSHHECLWDERILHEILSLRDCVILLPSIARIINRNNSQSDIIFHPFTDTQCISFLLREEVSYFMSSLFYAEDTCKVW